MLERGTNAKDVIRWIPEGFWWVLQSSLHYRLGGYRSLRYVAGIRIVSYRLYRSWVVYPQEVCGQHKEKEATKKEEGLI